MKTNAIMDSIRKTTPPEVNKQVDLCVEICNRIYEIMEERGMQINKVSYNLVLKSQTSISIISLWLHRAPLACVDFRETLGTCLVQLITV